MSEKSGVYMIECLVNGKKYIGSSKNLKQRITSHKTNLFRGNHHCVDLQIDYDLYGEENFKFFILDYCSEAECRKKEIEYIERWNIKEEGYNTYNLKDSIKKKQERFFQKIFEYAKKYGYKSDGKFHTYNIFDIAKETKYSVTEILSNFGINHKSRWNITIPLNNKNKDYIALNWNNEQGLVIHVLNEDAFNNPNTETDDFYY